MPMLFYLPMIFWLGIYGVVQDELYPAAGKKTVKR